jgi:NDP-sugar pyrophosphorylase family protein
LVVNVHHKAAEIDNFIKGLPFNVHVSHEEKILGTAGGLARARHQLRGAPVIVANGDILGQIPVTSLLARAEAGLVLSVTQVSGRAGTVGMGKDGDVVRLRGEIFGQEIQSGDYMGAAVLGSECLESLPEEGCLVGDWALPHLRRGGRIGTVQVNAAFEDVGTPSAYLNAHLTRLGGRAYIEAGATVGQGVTLERSYVGENARIEGAGKLEDCVVLKGATATAPLRRAVVTPAGRVMEVPD